MKDAKSNSNLIASISHSCEWALVGPMAGDLPELPASLPILAVDGGARCLTRMDLWVGDGDSHSGSVPCRHVLRFPVEKDASDLAFALELFERRSDQKLHLWGFLGGRRDHELFNLGEVLKFLEDQFSSQVWIYDSESRVAFKAYSPGTWELEHRGIFSLGSLQSGPVKLLGNCLYRLNGEILGPLSSRGLSNSAEGVIFLEAPMATFIYFPETP